jgi:ferrous iron transport protein A
MKLLKDARIGETLTVQRLHGDGALKRRIMDMGITRGVQVYVRKVAPLGDPVEITVRGYELSIRKEDAQLVEVEDVADETTDAAATQAAAPEAAQAATQAAAPEATPAETPAPEATPAATPK